MSDIIDELPIFQSSCDFSHKFSKQFSNLGPKQAKEKAELVGEIDKLVREIILNRPKGASHRNIRNVIGVKNVSEFKSKKTKLRIYFTIRNNRPLILLYGKKKTQKKDILWLKNNHSP